MLYVTMILRIILFVKQNILDQVYSLSSPDCLIQIFLGSLRASPAIRRSSQQCISPSPPRNKMSAMSAMSATEFGSQQASPPLPCSAAPPPAHRAPPPTPARVWAAPARDALPRPPHIRGRAAAAAGEDRGELRVVDRFRDVRRDDPRPPGRGRRPGRWRTIRYGRRRRQPVASRHLGARRGGEEVPRASRRWEEGHGRLAPRRRVDFSSSFEPPGVSFGFGPQGPLSCPGHPLSVPGFCTNWHSIPSSSVARFPR